MRHQLQSFARESPTARIGQKRPSDLGFRPACHRLHRACQSLATGLPERLGYLHPPARRVQPMRPTVPKMRFARRPPVLRHPQNCLWCFWSWGPQRVWPRVGLCLFQCSSEFPCHGLGLGSGMQHAGEFIGLSLLAALLLHLVCRLAGFQNMV